MRVETSRFGVQEVPDDSVIRFPEGLPGFQTRAFVLLHHEDSPMVEWLQSAEEPTLALMTVDPVELFIDYQPKVKPAELQAIHPDDGVDKLICRVIIRRGDEPHTLFVNLFAPIFLNVERRLAIQVPLVGSGFSVREVWPPAPAPAPEDAETPRQAPPRD